MNLTGHLNALTRDFKTGKPIISLVINEELKDDISALQEVTIDIELKKHREKRSLDANGLLWHCIGKLSAALRTDKWQVYLLMLKRYGKYTYICVKPGVVDAIKSQWRECEEVGEIDINGSKAIQLLCYFGSSSYNTQEFSVLLDGVISEMKEMGLETPTSEEMQRSLEQWEKLHQ